MAKKMVKKRKLRVFRFLLLILILIGLFFGVYFYLHLPIYNVLIKNTEYVNDDYILEIAGIKNYPSYWLTRSKKIEEKLLKSPYIESVNVKRKFFNTFVININENRPLFYNQTDNSVVFENKVSLKVTNTMNFRIPRLLNYVPDNKYNSFIKGMGNIKEDTLGKISDIEYQPNDYDKERFLLYMDDGNMVYLTLTKFEMINYYNDVLSQLEDRKGILYLDNGNHFQIKE